MSRVGPVFCCFGGGGVLWTLAGLAGGSQGLAGGSQVTKSQRKAEPCSSLPWIVQCNQLLTPLTTLPLHAPHAREVRRCSLWACTTPVCSLCTLILQSRARLNKPLYKSLAAWGTLLWQHKVTNNLYIQTTKVRQTQTARSHCCAPLPGVCPLPGPTAGSHLLVSDSTPLVQTQESAFLPHPQTVLLMGNWESDSADINWLKRALILEKSWNLLTHVPWYQAKVLFQGKQAGIKWARLAHFTSFSLRYTRE